MTGPHPIDLGDEPQLSDIYQREIDNGVLVRQAGPVETRQVPPRAGGMQLVTLVDTTVGPPESIGGNSPLRSQLYVIAVDQPVWLGLTRAQVTSGQAFYLPAGQSLTIHHAEQVYAACAATGQTARLSVLLELWA